MNGGDNARMEASAAPSTVGEARNAGAPPRRRWGVGRDELALLALLLLILGVSGPFGTYAADGWSARIAYWARTLLVGYCIYRPLIALAARHGGGMGGSAALAWVAAVLAGGIPMTLWLWYAGPVIDFARPWPDAGQFVDTYAQILFVAGLATTALFAWRARDARPAEPPVAAPGRPALAARLPAHLGDDIRALGVEDHYVRVHTARGDTLLLMRLGDAIAEMAPVAGAQVHRSWWIARHAVEGAAREGDSWRLRLTGGLAVPVARARVAALRADGWLD